jgi:hypothetical protein
MQGRALWAAALVAVIGLVSAGVAVAKGGKAPTAAAKPAAKARTAGKAPARTAEKPPAPAEFKGTVHGFKTTREWLGSMDKDKNGIVTKAEFKGTPDEFRSLDTDRDGKLTLSKPAAKPAPKTGKTVAKAPAKSSGKKVTGKAIALSPKTEPMGS